MQQQQFQNRYIYNPQTDKLGEGGFGNVFRAYDNHRDIYVALKIQPVRRGMENLRLAKEVQMVSALPIHPNIAVYETCYTFPSLEGENDIAVLQYYEEGNLNSLLKRVALNNQQKEAILLQILDGVAFLHHHGIIHRDLKPQNVLMVNRKGYYVPKITDFGISKQLDVNKSSCFSNSIAGAGTIAYASPEQLGDRTIAKNTDLWSFGVIAYQVFTGDLPFTTGGFSPGGVSGHTELLRQISAGQLPPKIATIPSLWQNTIRHCLVTDPNYRVKSTDEVKRLLNQPVTPPETVYEKRPHNTPLPPVQSAPGSFSAPVAAPQPQFQQPQYQQAPYPQPQFQQPQYQQAPYPQPQFQQPQYQQAPYPQPQFQQPPYQQPWQPLFPKKPKVHWTAKFIALPLIWFFLFCIFCTEGEDFTSTDFFIGLIMFGICFGIYQVAKHRKHGTTIIWVTCLIILVIFFFVAWYGFCNSLFSAP